jgi:predicted Zn-dependent peptidase
VTEVIAKTRKRLAPKFVLLALLVLLLEQLRPTSVFSTDTPSPTAKPAEAELARAKAQLKAGLLMGLESSSARAEQMEEHHDV